MPEEKKVDPFKPQQPRIPGVSDQPKPAPKPAPPKHLSTKSGSSANPEKSEGMPIMWVAFIVLALVICIGAAWWTHRSFAKESETVAKVDAPAVVVEEKPKASEKLPMGPGEIATTTQLEKVWSSQRFLFRNTITSEIVPAMVVHLPSGVYWGFSLHEPYGTCELEFVTDLSRLENDYHYRADHPMVGDTCNRTVFDLEKYGTGPNGLVRGEIVQGAAVRPPMAIEIKTKGNQLIAVRME
jgi:hypothetical protein